jgi:osmotically-inducible protein OsmY
MKRLLTLSMAAVCLAIGIAACERSPRAAENKMSDSDLERAISSSINNEPNYAAYNIGVSADVDKNTATLTGTVPTEAARARVVELAKAGHAGLVVTDKIDVKPAEPDRRDDNNNGNTVVERKDYTPEMARDAREKAKGSGESIGESVDDAWIHTKIRTKLVGEGELPGGGVNVDVKNNVVTLRGYVKTKEDRAKVEEVAKTTDGVKSVRNLLTVRAK